VEVKEIRVKSILSVSQVADWTINPYVGCQYACAYCYAQYMKRFTGHRENWGDFIDIKVNAPELLQNEIGQKKRGRVWMSGVCDPYQPIEEHYQLSHRCLRILAEHDWPMTIQTKSPLILRDLDLLKQFSEVEVGFTITTGDERIRQIFEPKAPTIKMRLEALWQLHQSGLKTYVMIAPMLPGAEGLVSQIRDRVDYVLIDKLNYHYADRLFEKHNLTKINQADELITLLQEANIPLKLLF
jgi:DNA repair photolyase